ncbi:hypothetical protein CHUAL_001171 [Chamberlinius hualienensis]
MDQIWPIFHGFFRGLKDSLCCPLIMYNLYVIEKQEIELEKKEGTSRKRKLKRKDEHSITTRFIHCCALNGGVCLLSILVFNYLVLPGLQMLTSLLFVSSLESANAIWSVIQPILSITFETIWVIPVYAISKFLNLFWFQDIADTVFRRYHGRSKSLVPISTFIADTVFSVIIQSLFLIQVSAQITKTVTK